MKWWRKLLVNQKKGIRLVIVDRYRRKSRLIVLQFGISPGQDLLGDDAFLWEYDQRHY